MSFKNSRKIEDDNDDDFQYEPSDSEDDYTPQQKELIGEVLAGNADQSDSEVEVYGVRSDSSSDDSDIALSDVEGQDENDDLPNLRAWGKDKRNFYSTDYVDQDYGGFQGQDAMLADLEEQEATNLHKQLIEQMDEDDFAFDLISKGTKTDDKQAEEIVKTDVSKLSKRQKIELFYKESPEFSSLIEDFKSKMQIVGEFLSPILLLFKRNKIKDSNALQFTKVYYEVISNYCTNINMYLLLKASRVNVQNHPVIKRLYQYRKLLCQLDPVYEEIVKPQIENLIENNKMVTEKPKKVLKLLNKLGRKTKPEAISDMAKISKKQKLNEEIKGDNKIEKEVSKVDEVEENVNEEETDSRRAITYQIAKNKGLTPHRNKLQRNPRVKNRDKYRKALIRRKGAVREVRTELSRYGGELSGIKASVSKSIKIKS